MFTKLAIAFALAATLTYNVASNALDSVQNSANIKATQLEQIMQ